MKLKTVLSMLAGACVIVTALPAMADDFRDDDLKQWEQEFHAVATKGRELWVSSKLGTNGVVCAQCHPNAANTHPETYPKFQKQLGKVADTWEMVNWCIRNPLQGKSLKADDPDMIALISYIRLERKGVKLDPGKH